MLRYERSAGGRHRWTGEHHGRDVEVIVEPQHAIGGVVIYGYFVRADVRIVRSRLTRIARADLQSPTESIARAVRAAFEALRELTRDAQR